MRIFLQNINTSVRTDQYADSHLLKPTQQHSCLVRLAPAAHFYTTMSSGIAITQDIIRAVESETGFPTWLKSAGDAVSPAQLGQYLRAVIAGHGNAAEAGEALAEHSCAPQLVGAALWQAHTADQFSGAMHRAAAAKPADASEPAPLGNLQRSCVWDKPAILRAQSLLTALLATKPRAEREDAIATLAALLPLAVTTALGLVPADSAVRLRKHRTRQAYQQSKYNLFQEASEGWAKVATQVTGITCPAEVPQAKARVSALIGHFSLDPNRVADVVLGAMVSAMMFSRRAAGQQVSFAKLAALHELLNIFNPAHVRKLVLFRIRREMAEQEPAARKLSLLHQPTTLIPLLRVCVYLVMVGTLPWDAVWAELADLTAAGDAQHSQHVAQAAAEEARQALRAYTVQSLNISGPAGDKADGDQPSEDAKTLTAVHADNGVSTSAALGGAPFRDIQTKLKTLAHPGTPIFPAVFDLIHAAVSVAVACARVEIGLDDGTPGAPAQYAPLDAAGARRWTSRAWAVVVHSMRQLLAAGLPWPMLSLFMRHELVLLCATLSAGLDGLLAAVPEPAAAQPVVDCLQRMQPVLLMAAPALAESPAMLQRLLYACRWLQIACPAPPTSTNSATPESMDSVRAPLATAGLDGADGYSLAVQLNATVLQVACALGSPSSMICTQVASMLAKLPWPVRAAHALGWLHDATVPAVDGGSARAYWDGWCPLPLEAACAVRDAALLAGQYQDPGSDALCALPRGVLSAAWQYNSQLLEIAAARCTWATKQALKRVAKGTEQLAGFQLAKATMACPITAANTLCDYIERFGNLVDDLLSCMGTVSNAVLDAAVIVAACRLRREGVAGVQRDGLAPEAWVQHLAAFIARLLRKFPTLQAAPVWQSAIDCAVVEELSALEVLGTLLAVAGGQESLPAVTLAQAGAATGTSTLAEAAVVLPSSDVHDAPTPAAQAALLRAAAAGWAGLPGPSAAVGDAIVSPAGDCGQPAPLYAVSLALAGMAGSATFGELAAGKHVKNVSAGIDLMQSCIAQYAAFVRCSVPIALLSQHVPPLVHMCSEHGMPDAAAWPLLRPMVRAATWGPDVLTQHLLPTGWTCPAHSKHSMLSEHLHEQARELLAGRPAPGCLRRLLQPAEAGAAVPLAEVLSPAVFTVFWSLDAADVAMPAEQYAAALRGAHDVVQSEDAAAYGKARGQSYSSSVITRARRIHAQLKQDQEQQEAHVARVSSLLREASATLAVPTEHGMLPEYALVQACLLPRAASSPADAVYCAQWLQVMSSLGVPGWSLHDVLSALFAAVPQLLSSMTERETRHVSIMLYHVLRDVQGWCDRVAFDAAVAAGVLGSPKASGAGTALAFDDWVHAAEDWAAQLSQAMTACLRSREYIIMKSSIVLAHRLLTESDVQFPPAGKPTAALLATLQHIHRTDDRKDIQTPAGNLAGRLSRLVESRAAPGQAAAAAAAAAAASTPAPGKSTASQTPAAAPARQIKPAASSKPRQTAPASTTPAATAAKPPPAVSYSGSDSDEGEVRTAPASYKPPHARSRDDSEVEAAKLRALQSVQARSREQQQQQQHQPRGDGQQGPLRPGIKRGRAASPAEPSNRDRRDGGGWSQGGRGGEDSGRGRSPGRDSHRGDWRGSGPRMMPPPPPSRPNEDQGRSYGGQRRRMSPPRGPTGGGDMRRGQSPGRGGPGPANRAGGHPDSRDRQPSRSPPRGPPPARAPDRGPSRGPDRGPDRGPNRGPDRGMPPRDSGPRQRSRSPPGGGGGSRRGGRSNRGKRGRR